MTHWTEDIENDTDEKVRPGTYSAVLTKIPTKISKAGDNMLHLIFSVGSQIVSRYVVIRKDLARMWISDCTNIGVDTTAVIATAREQDLNLLQFFWELHARALERLGSTVEVAVTYKPGSDFPDVKIRRLIADPAGDLNTEPEPEPEDGIPF